MKVCEPVLPAGSSCTSVPMTHLTESFGSKDCVIYSIFYNLFPASSMQWKLYDSLWIYTKLLKERTLGNLKGDAYFTDRSALETSRCCPALPALHQIQEAVILRGYTCSLMKDQWPKEDVHYSENRKQSSIGFLTEMGVPVSAKHRQEGRKAWRATNHTQNLLWSSAIWLKLGTLWLMEGCESPDPWSIPWEMQMCMSRPESCIPQPWADTHMTRACRCLFMLES